MVIYICLILLFKLVHFHHFQGHITAKNPEAAISLHNEMSHLGLKLDRLSYNTLILACVKTGKLDVAVSFYEELKVAVLCC